MSERAGRRVSRPWLPGYGVPGEEKGRLLPWEWAAGQLRKSHNYWLTTVRPDGRPHTMPVWGVWFGDRFWFSTGSRSRKHLNLEANPACVVANEAAAEAVIVEGVARRVSASEELAEFSRVYEEKYSVDQADASEPIYAVVPTVVFGFIEAEFITSPTRWHF